MQLVSVIFWVDTELDTKSNSDVDADAESLSCRCRYYSTTESRRPTDLPTNFPPPLFVPIIFTLLIHESSPPSTARGV
jgi:hypothetical protein